MDQGFGRVGYAHTLVNIKYENVEHLRLLLNRAICTYHSGSPQKKITAQRTWWVASNSGVDLFRVGGAMILKFVCSNY